MFRKRDQTEDIKEYLNNSKNQMYKLFVKDVTSDKEYQVEKIVLQSENFTEKDTLILWHHTDKKENIEDIKFDWEFIRESEVGFEVEGKLNTLDEIGEIVKREISSHQDDRAEYYYLASQYRRR